MLRNAFLWLTLGSLIPISSFATVDSPVVQGLGGGGRAGVPREALFSNPAAVVAVGSTFGFVHYEIPQVPDFNARGRGWSVGIYDVGDQTWKGGFAYTRTSKARILNAQQSYVDRSSFRFATGHAITGSIIGGLRGRLERIHGAGDGTKYFDADLGILFPFFNDIRAGFTIENVADKDLEEPRTIGLGAAYSLGYGIQFLADGYRIMTGKKEGERGWSLSFELGLAGDFLARAGVFEEAFRALKGWSAGLSWMGPRASFDYALKVTGRGPRERAHILGMTLAL